MYRLFILLFPVLLFGQQTYIPDNNFEQALIDLGYDDILDNSVLTDNISSITSLDISSLSIANLTGIEDFLGLEILLVNDNDLNELNISQNINLTKLECANNQLSSLDISTNINLDRLLCHTNELSALDVSQNIELLRLECYSNQITEIDVSQNPLLITFYCGANLLTSLDVSQNTDLLYLGFVLNQISSIDLSSNINLTNLNCHNNSLIQLDISNNININYLSCYNNNLNCIKVWDVSYAEDAEILGNWEKDDSAFWSEDCSGCGDINACNYDPFAYPEDNSLCLYPDAYYDCDGNCLNDIDLDFICDEIDDCVGQYDECGVCNGTGPDDYYDCDGNCLNDIDLDLICDEIDDCIGAYDECGVCNGTGPDDYYDCDGNCLNDMDFDLICDEFDDCENDPFNDIDNDGVCGDLDMCDGFDDNIDIDNDGIPDGCDNCISTNTCFIPTGFSPNGDGINDVWLLCCNEFNNAEVSVYNRWGQLVFYTPDNQSNWDGKYESQVMPTADYFYLLKTDTQKTYQGRITLKR